MTKAERNTKLIALIERETKRGLKSKSTARSMLIAEGIYTPKGNLKKAFGGRGAKGARVPLVEAKAN